MTKSVEEMAGNIELRTKFELATTLTDARQ
jgi:hypothetical protein